MEKIKTSQKLIERLEKLLWNKSNQEEFKNLLQLLKLAINKDHVDFDSITQNIDEGFAHCKIICDEKGDPYDYKFISVNNAFEKQSGLKINDIIGKTWLEIFPDAGKSWINFYGKVALTQQPNSRTHYGPSTKRHYVVSSFSAAHGEFTAIFKDISESIELEVANKKIIKSREENKRVLTNMQEAYSHFKIICDKKGKPVDGKFLFVNDAFENQTGIKAKDALGNTLLGLFPNYEKSWIKIFGKVALTMESKSFIKFNQDTNRYYQTNAFAPSKGEFAVFFRDVTEQEIKRIALEEAFKKAKENEQLKSAFLANMSHEVRTPMNAILGFSNLLEDEGVSSTDKKTYLKQIKTSGNRLLTIISDIVDISKIDAKQQKLVLAECDLNQLFDELLNRYTILNTNNNISLKIDKGIKNHPFIIATDETRLNQVLSNLIENALKYSVKGQITFGYAIKNDTLQFYVKDTGLGIKKSDQKMIFERFGQIHNKAGLVTSGNGLGIPIAKGIVDLFKGKLWLESELEVGSTFYFKIPYSPKEKNAVNTSYKQTILIA